MVKSSMLDVCALKSPRRYMSADLVKGVFGHSSTFYAIKI